jgi:uncharacterized glyoxalase superfamily protein PhnB
MDFVSIRVITADIARLVAFYERVTGLPASWATEDFAEIRTPTATLAIGSTRTVPLFTPDDPGSARPGGYQSVIVEFRVEDVDQVYANLSLAPADLVQEPTTMPWGNRSLLLRDPDGTLVNLFTPLTPTARAPREERGPSAETTR